MVKKIQKNRAPFRERGVPSRRGQTQSPLKRKLQLEASKIRKIVSRNIQQQGPTKRFERFLDNKHGQTVIGVAINRKPIDSKIFDFLDASSSGEFEKKRQELGYDNIYHNFLIITLSDGTQWVIEKNHVVEHRPATSKDLDGAYPIGMGNQEDHLSLKQMIDQAEQLNPSQFWKYDSQRNNCQLFTEMIIKGNQLEIPNQETEDIVNPQDSEQLQEPLPGVVRDIILPGATNLASALDKTLEKIDPKLPEKIFAGKGIILKGQQRSRLRF